MRRKSIAVKKGSHIGNVTNNEESCDTVNRLTVCHANEEKESSASRSPSLNRLQAKVSSFTAFTGVHKANQAEKRREVNTVVVSRLMLSSAENVVTRNKVFLWSLRPF